MPVNFPVIYKTNDHVQFSILFAQGAVIGIDDEDDSTFTVTVDQKTFHFQGK
jgi:hypothetical protein